MMKNQTLFSKAIMVFMAAAIFLSSCSSSTLIQTVPSNARVTIDGERVGTTPYTHTDTKIIFSNTTIVLEKEGYEPFATTITRNEEPNVGAIIGGIFIWPIWLWALDYKASRTYELRPEN
jgi:hypothetical protein